MFALFQFEGLLIQLVAGIAGDLCSELDGCFKRQILQQNIQDTGGFRMRLFRHLWGSGHDQDKFATPIVRIGIQPGHCFIQRTDMNALEQLGQFARERNLPVPSKYLAQVGRAFQDSVGCFMEDERTREKCEFLQFGAACCWLWRKEAIEEEMGRVEPGCRERGNGGVGARNRNYGVAGVPDRLHQQIARIADRGSAGIRHKCNGMAIRKQFNDFWRSYALIVLMERKQAAGRYAVVSQQMYGVAGVLGGNNVCTREHIEGAKANVTKVSNWRGNYI